MLVMLLLNRVQIFPTAQLRPLLDDCSNARWVRDVRLKLWTERLNLVEASKS